MVTSGLGVVGFHVVAQRDIDGAGAPSDWRGDAGVIRAAHLHACRARRWLALSDACATATLGGRIIVLSGFGGKALLDQRIGAARPDGGHSRAVARSRVMLASSSRRPAHARIYHPVRTADRQLLHFITIFEMYGGYLRIHAAQRMATDSYATTFPTACSVTGTDWLVAVATLTPTGGGPLGLPMPAPPPMICHAPNARSPNRPRRTNGRLKKGRGP
jgi:hypothetical protein